MSCSSISLIMIQVQQAAENLKKQFKKPGKRNEMTLSCHLAIHNVGGLLLLLTLISPFLSSLHNLPSLPPSISFPSSSSSSSLSAFLSSSYLQNDDDVFPAAVDCTLSLATPSSTPPRRTSTCTSHFYRDIFPPPPTAAAFVHQYHDSNIVPRQCANCHTTSTPLWRNGPLGPKSLCNACGIRYKKQERRAYAAAAAAAAAAVNGGSDGPGVAIGSEIAQRVMNTPWALPHYTQAPKKGCLSTSAAYGGRNELRLLDVGGGDHRGRDSDFIAWRHLSNVVFFPGNRSPAIVHDFITR